MKLTRKERKKPEPTPTKRTAVKDDSEIQNSTSAWSSRSWRKKVARSMKAV